MIKFLVVGQQLRIVTPVVVSDTINYLEAEAEFKGEAWEEIGLSKWVHFQNGDDIYSVPLFNDKIIPEQGLNLTAGTWEVFLTGTVLEDDTETVRVTTTSELLQVRTAQSVNPFPALTPEFSEIVATLAHQALEIANTVKLASEAGDFDGATFIPHLTPSGDEVTLSWTNDRSLPNPEPVNIKGERGTDGTGLVIKGYYATLEDLEEAVPAPEIGDVYGVGTEDPFDIYVWDGINEEWVNNGSIQGPPGEPGTPGAPGEPGEPGYTPVKGVDYFTAAELAQVALAAAGLVTPGGIGAIPDPDTKSSGQSIMWNGTAWVADNPGVSSVNGSTGDVLTRKIFHNQTVSTWYEMSTPTFTDYPFYASVALSGVVSSDIPEVVFDPVDADSGNFCPVADSYDGGVYIYAKEEPEDTITIKTILIQR